MIERGLYTTEADCAAHYCPIDNAFYVYRYDRIKPIADELTEKKIKSAIGRLLPISRYQSLTYKIPVSRALREDVFNKPVKEMTDNEAGAKAESLFRQMLASGDVCLPAPVVATTPHTSKKDQYAGKDFSIHFCASMIVDVKFDGPGGINAGATGNLFIQTHEGDTMSGDRHQYNHRNAHRAN